MKKILVLTSMLAVAGCAIGQGTVNFINFSINPSIQAQVRGADGNLVGNLYYGQLFAGAAGTAEASLTAVGNPVLFNNNASTGAPTGVVNGGSQTIVGVGGAQPAVVQLRAWAAASGATWAEASANPTGEFGSSNLINITTGDPGPPAGPPAFLVGLQPFNVVLVPEPSTWALLALGVGALALRRRRNN